MTAVDNARCYSISLSASMAERRVWMMGGEMFVVVADDDDLIVVAFLIASSNPDGML